MIKWERLRKLYNWKIETLTRAYNEKELDNNGIHELMNSKHLLVEMDRIDNDWNKNMAHAKAIVEESEKAIIDYLENIMHNNPKWNTREHAEQIIIRLAQIEDEFKLKEF